MTLTLHQPESIRPIQTSPAIDGRQDVLLIMPPWIQKLFMRLEDGLEELAIDYGSLLCIRSHGVVRLFKSNSEEVFNPTRDDIEKWRLEGMTISKHDVDYIKHKLPGGFRSDGRCGLEGTVHRISSIEDREHRITGVSIRIGRFITGVAEPLRENLIKKPSFLVVGKPGSGKSTFLRDAIRILGTVYYNQVVAVDTSNELGGDGMMAHAGLGTVRRIQVGSPDKQRKVLMQAVGNHSPKIIIVDEIGVNNDIDVIETIGVRGIDIIASAHGWDAKDVMGNPDLHPILGGFNADQGKRKRNATFKQILEIRGKNDYWLYPDTNAVVDAFARGENIFELAIQVGLKTPIPEAA
jgi:stage III sporulation protein SpoIIIAA